MKILRITLALVVFIVALGFNTNHASAQTFAQYVSGVTIQNLYNGSTTVTANYVNSAGVTIFSTTDTINAFGVKDYASVPVGTGFQGSLILSANNPIGAVSTLRGDNKGRGAYVGNDAGGTSVNLPMLMKNWGSSQWNTWFAVQNVGGTSATVTVKYAACASALPSVSIPAGAMVTFNQKTAACLTATKVITSATITSTQPVVAVVSQESSVVNASLVSPGFSSGDTKPVIPLLNSNNPTATGWRTAISVFNQSTTTSTSVKMTYVKAADGSTCTETQTIQPQQSATFAGNNLITGQPYVTCPAGVKLVGSAYVSSNSANVPLVATVNQDRGGLASAYGAFSPAAGSPTIFFPQIQDRNGATNQWASSIMIMNVGTSPVYVKCTFANSSYAPVSGALATYKAWENLQRGNIAAGYVGSGICTAYTSSSYTTVATDAKIVGVANVRGLGSNYDLMMSYEGLNQ